MKTAAGPKGFFSLYAFSACPSEESSRTVASSSAPSTPSWASTRGSEHRHVYFASTFAAAQTAIIWALVHTFVSGEYSGFYTLSSLSIPSFSTLRAWPSARRSPSCSSRQHPDQLFGVGALARRGLLPFRGFVREVPLALLALHLSAREAVQVTATPLLAGPSSYQLAARSFQWYQLLVSRLLNAAFFFFLAIGQKAAPCQKKV